MNTPDDSTTSASLADLRASRWYTPGSEEIDAAHEAAWERIRELNALGNTDQARAKELLAEISRPGPRCPACSPRCTWNSV